MNKKTAYLLTGILLLAALVRVLGIGFGLPLQTHADEPIVVNHAIAYGSGDFHPHYFKLPSSLSYILFFVYAIFFLIGKIFGFFANAGDYLQQFLIDPTRWYLIGRFLVGVCGGTLTVYCVYCLAKRVLSQKGALLCALLFAFSFIHVLHSHYIYCDIPLVISVVWVAIAALRLYEKPTIKRYIVAGALVGLSCAFKYNGLLSVIAVIVAHSLSSERRSACKPLVCIVFCVLAFFVFTPYAFFDFPFFKQEIMEQAAAESSIGWWYHIRFSLANGVGWGMLLCAAAGVVWVTLRKRRKDWIVLSFPLLFFVTTGVFSQDHERYVLPLIPFVSLYAASFLCALHENIVRTNKKFPRWSIRALHIFIVIAVCMPNVVRIIALDHIALRPDTRTLAKTWIETHIPSGSRIALDHTFFCPRLWPTKEQLTKKLDGVLSSGQRTKIETLRDAKAYPSPNYEVFYLWDSQEAPPDFVFARPVIAYDFDVLQESGIDYVVIHRDLCGSGQNDFASELGARARLVKTITPYYNALLCSQEPVVNTGLPFLGRELFVRKNAGYPIFIYSLKGDG